LVAQHQRPTTLVNDARDKDAQIIEMVHRVRARSRPRTVISPT
jgi:hypothetical protein